MTSTETHDPLSDPLRDQLTAFGNALLDQNNSGPALRLLRGDPVRALRRLAVYRGNVVSGVRSALRAHFPVVLQLVGDEFFDALARDYWVAHPSMSGDLGEYGAALPRFLEGFEHARDLPYLPEVARLEWAVHCAEIAADQPPQPSPNSMPREPALLWMPGTSVLVSDFPIADIWLAHQPESQIDLARLIWRAQGALVFRNELRVDVAALDSAEARVLLDLLSSAA